MTKFNGLLVRLRSFTLIEMLLSVALIGMLLSLVLPAIQWSREAARQVQCKNNLRQIGIGLLLHEQSKGYFPYGGWGHQWVGVPGRGSGVHQPGGWIYSTLPYLELYSVHQMGEDPDQSDVDQLYSRRLNTPLSLFTCPTRRPCDVWRVSDSKYYFSHPKPWGIVSEVARADYAINGGFGNVASWPGPSSLKEGDQENYYWPVPRDFNGISHLRTGSRIQEISDGLTHTYLLGEKFLNPDHYTDGESQGDNETLYSGYATDLHRFAREDLLPMQDTSQITEANGHVRFGSAHANGCYFAFCDASVRSVSYAINVALHIAQANRQDQMLHNNSN